MIETLLHATPSLEAILRSGFLRSASSLGRKGTHGEDPDAVYLTPTDNKGIPVPHADTMFSVFHLDAKKVFRDFPMFFMNESNAFGPGDGQPYNGKCTCRKTYNTTHKKKSGPCVYDSFEAIANVLVYDLSHCDGGPEVGIYQDIPLQPYLLYVTVHKKDYDALPQDIRAQYGEMLRVV
jgi:hypothetical protein